MDQLGSDLRLPPRIQYLISSDGPMGRRGELMRNFRILVISAAALLCLSWVPALAQTDPGVRGGMANTAGALQQRGIPIPHPPVIGPNPTTGATINNNELASFNEGVL